MSSHTVIAKEIYSWNSKTFEKHCLYHLMEVSGLDNMKHRRVSGLHSIIFHGWWCRCVWTPVLLMLFNLFTCRLCGMSLSVCHELGLNTKLGISHVAFTFLQVMAKNMSTPALMACKKHSDFSSFSQWNSKLSFPLIFCLCGRGGAGMVYMWVWCQ